MYAETVHVCIDAYYGTVMLHDVMVDRIRMQMFGEYLGDVILYRPEERTFKIILVLGSIQILRDESLCFQADRDVAGLVSLAMHAKVQHAFPLLQIAHTKPTQLLPTQAMVQQRGEDGAVTFAFERLPCWCIEQHARLLV